MRRREFITLLGGAAAWPLAGRAQQQSRILRVGFVGIQPRDFRLYAAFLERMAELGYQEGRNFAFEFIQAANIDAYEQSYRELATRQLDVFFAVGNEPALRAALLGGGRTRSSFWPSIIDPADQRICGKPVTAWGQRDRHFRAPARTRRQNGSKCSRSVPPRKDGLDRVRYDLARARRCGRGGRLQARPRAPYDRASRRAILITITYLASQVVSAGNRSFCRQARCSCATVKLSRKRCSSTAFRRSPHSARIWRTVR